MTTDTDAADTDTAKILAKMSGQEHMVYTRNDEWQVFLKLMTAKNAMMTTKPNEIVTMLVKKEDAIKRENGLAPEALLFAKKGGKGSKGGKHPKREERNYRDNWKEKDQGNCIHC